MVWQSVMLILSTGVLLWIVSILYYYSASLIITTCTQVILSNGQTPTPYNKTLTFLLSKSKIPLDVTTYRWLYLQVFIGETKRLSLKYASMLKTQSVCRSHYGAWQNTILRLYAFFPWSSVNLTRRVAANTIRTLTKWWPSFNRKNRQDMTGL